VRIQEKYALPPRVEWFALGSVDEANVLCRLPPGNGFRRLLRLLPFLFPARSIPPRFAV
jgi:hypothetical protein